MRALNVDRDINKFLITLRNFRDNPNPSGRSDISAVTRASYVEALDLTMRSIFDDMDNGVSHTDILVRVYNECDHSLERTANILIHLCDDKGLAVDSREGQILMGTRHACWTIQRLLER